MPVQRQNPLAGKGAQKRSAGHQRMLTESGAAMNVLDEERRIMIHGEGRERILASWRCAEITRTGQAPGTLAIHDIDHHAGHVEELADHVHQTVELGIPGSLIHTQTA